MPFRRFFDRGAKRESSVAEDAPADTPESEEVEEQPQELEAESGAEWADAEAGVPEGAADIDWLERAIAVLPAGASTGSKRVEALYGDAAATGPTHYMRAGGCRFIDPAGNSYIDCTMALGAVALGYAEPRVQEAVIQAVAGGNVAGLSDVREVELAERLREHIPCAEMVQFLKSGAEAVSAAVRIARTYTGRDLVVGSGYFGWHDWSSDSAGVPSAVRELLRAVPFDDVAALDGVEQMCERIRAARALVEQRGGEFASGAHVAGWRGEHRVDPLARNRGTRTGSRGFAERDGRDEQEREYCDHRDLLRREGPSSGIARR